MQNYQKNPLLCHTAICVTQKLITTIIFFCFSENLPQPDKHTLTIMKELSSACQQNPTCLKVEPLERLACIRRCVSPGCYAKIYSQNPLEPGEIDVLYPTYKACFHSVWKDKYRSSLKLDQDDII